MASELAMGTLDQFFSWVNERHRIHVRRQAGEPKPWTQDRILRDYKFTNPFRQNDRGTVWLTENFVQPWERGELPGGLDILAFNIAWYRMFNWTGTGALLGWKTDWVTDDVQDTLERALNSGNQVFTGAHIVYSPPGLGKVEAITDVCAEFWKLREQIVERARSTQSLEETYHLLRTVYCVGGFMAYEIVTDYRWTPLLEDAHDIVTWANPGPGAKRGLQRLGYKSTPDGTAIEAMRDILRISQEPGWLWAETPALELRDVEHSLCEFDKYMRVLSGEGEPRSKFNGRA